MSTLVWCELVCGSCSTQFGGHYTRGRLMRGQLKKFAKRKGWVFHGDEAFCGEACRASWLTWQV
jgi:hypothetical protein